MRRIAGILLTLAGAAALTFFATGASKGAPARSYWVELDDAFGLVSGGDLKIAGVRAGTIGDMKVEPRSHRALVQVKINKTGFGSLRTDVTCQARPQSLIGEYFLDCQPGTNPVELRPGSTIPVTRTSSVVAPDLVQDVLRKPYRERFSIIVNSLGAAVAGNARNLNDAIRRASPGLRETDRVLRILAEQDKVISDLIVNADKVIGDLSDNRREVARWVVTADRTAQASAERRSDIAAGFRKLPGFLEQLRPAMANLATVTDEQTPALRTLTLAAPNLKTFFDRLGPFSEASRPAFRALGRASQTGQRAVRAATPVVAQLNTFAKDTPELAKNLGIVLGHLDSPASIVEKDPRSPGGQGYTGLQALLEYVYDQVLSINVYDQSVHILKVSPFVGPCADYADVRRALSKEKDGTVVRDQCGAALGPNAAGINFPDASRPDGAFGVSNDAAARADVRRHRPAEPAATSTLAPAPAAPSGGPAVPTLGDVIPGAPKVVIPTPGAGVPAPATGLPAPKTQDRLLDYLLRP